MECLLTTEEAVKRNLRALHKNVETGLGRRFSVLPVLKSGIVKGFVFRRSQPYSQKIME